MIGSQVYIHCSGPNLMRYSDILDQFSCNCVCVLRPKKIQSCWICWVAYNLPFVFPTYHGQGKKDTCGSIVVIYFLLWDKQQLGGGISVAENDSVRKWSFFKKKLCLCCLLACVFVCLLTNFTYCIFILLFSPYSDQKWIIKVTFHLPKKLRSTCPILTCSGAGQPVSLPHIRSTVRTSSYLARDKRHCLCWPSVH